MGLEKNMETMMQMSAFSYDKMWDIAFASLSNFSWTQEQVEKLTQTYVEQRKVNRQEALKITEELMKQAQKNQQKMREIVEEAIESSLSGSSFFEFFKNNDISKKLEELEKKVDDLNNSSK